MSSESGSAVDNACFLENALTAARLSPYMKAMNNDLQGALRLYELNGRVGALLFQWLGLVEVILRNALTGQLRMASSSMQFDPFLALWSDLAPQTRASYQSAVARLEQKRGVFSFDMLVTELPFGFWKFLLSSGYQTTLWTQYFRHSFPFLKPKDRSLVYAAVQTCVSLRNLIAHHEPIFNRHLGQDLAKIQQIIGWISPEALEWARANLPAELIGVGKGE
jgi:hypothetical protein